MRRYCSRTIRSSICRFIGIALLSFILLPGLSWGDSADSKSGVSPNTLILPTGPGSLGGIGENVRANLNMGLMSYPIRIVTPKGRNGFSPNISISYSSGSGSGVVGIGWGLSAGSSIERMTVRGLPRYKDDDSFFAATGELVKIPNSPFYRPKVEGSFIRYRWIHSPGDQRGYWIAEYPDGSKGYFGADSNGNIDLNAQVYGAQGTFRWELRTQIDPNGNRIEYRYFRDGSQVYLEAIEWVFNDQNKPLYRVEFKYEPRPDPISDCKPGFDLTITKRLKQITVFSEGNRIRSYHLKFDVSSGLSRLIEVTQYGTDPNKPYPVKFTMKYSEATFSPQNSRMVQMPTSVSQDFRSRNADLIDINGDGLPDVVDTNYPKHQFHINVLTLDKNLRQKSHDFPINSIVENNRRLSAQLKNPSVQLLDYNGDGFTDMVDAVNRQIYINKGNSKWEDQSEALGNFPVTGKDPNMRFFDYNGDKAIDVISSNGTSTTYWVSDKKGNWHRVPGGVGIGASFVKDKIRLIDMNGDGLSDAVQIYEGTLRYRKYYGYGRWSDWIKVSVPGLTKQHADKAQFADINGDGLSDMVVFLGNSIMYFVNRNGLEFSKGQALKTFKGIDIPDSTQNSIRIADMNGNGSRDIVWISPSGKVTYLELFGTRPNLLVSISNGIGQRIEVSYNSSVYYYLHDKSLGKPWKNKLPSPFIVVSEIRTWAETDGSTKPRVQVQKIYYHDGFYDGREKKFRGFRFVETVFEGDGSAAERKDLLYFDVGDKDPYFHGKIKRRVFTDGSGKIFHERVWWWEDCGTPAGADPGLDPPVRFICLTAWEQLIKEGLKDSKSWKLLRQEQKYDKFGNIVFSANLGIKDVSGDEEYIRYTYITPKDPKSPSSIWNLRRLQKVEVCEKERGPCAEINYYYDGPPFKGLPAGQITKGNLMRVTVKAKLGSSKVIQAIRYKRDRYGNTIETLGPSGERRTVEWDPVYHLFPVKETIYPNDKVKLEASTQWDYRFNVVTKSVDFNGNITLYGYDEFGRLTSQLLPGDSLNSPSITYEYELKKPISRIIIRKRVRKNSPETTENISCFDGLGRKLAKKIKLENSRYIVLQHVEYNRLGLHAKAWKAYESDNSKCSFSAPSSVKYTSFFYDGLSRRVKQINPDGSIEKIVYEPLKTIEFDPEDTDPKSPHYNTPKITYFDGLNRPVKLTEYSAPGHPITYKFEYTLLNVLRKSLITKVIFPDGSVKTHEYDLLGNVLKIVDPDRGTITYKYNDSSKVIEYTDARGITRVYTYDKAGRVLSLQKKGDDSTRVEYQYDLPHKDFPTAKNLKSRLVRISYPYGAYLFSYSRRGNFTDVRHIFMGVTFDFHRELDLDDKVIFEKYPDGRTLSYKWNLGGQIVQIGKYIPYIKYTPLSIIKEWKAFNGVVTKYTFNIQDWVSSLEVKGPSSGFKLKYSYDKVGNILSISETHPAESFTNRYRYDSIYRLIEANLEDNKEVIEYKQDDLSNIKAKLSSLGKKSPVHFPNMSYDKKKIHALTKAGSRSFSYDKAGYLIKEGNRSYKWDFRGRLVEISEGGKKIARFWYDPDFVRVAKEEHGLHTFLISSDFQLRDGYYWLFIRLGRDRVIAWKSRKGIAKFFDDLAPAKKAGDKLKPEPDSVISVADAWLYYAAKNKILSLPLKKRSIDIDLTDDMLNAALHRLLDEKGEEVLSVHPDHIGSIRAVFDSKGKMITQKFYYPYGYIKKQRGRPFPYGFMGAELDSVSGFNHFLLRYYDAQVGRWTSPDPNFEKIGGISDDWNSYAAVSNNPISNREVYGAIGISVVSGAVSLGFDTIDFVRSGKSAWKNKQQSRKLSGTQKVSLFLGVISIGLGAASLSVKDDSPASAPLTIASGAVAVASTAFSLFSDIKQMKKNSSLISKKLKAGIIIGRLAVMGVQVAATVTSVAYDDPTTGAVLSIIGASGGFIVSVLADHFLSKSKGRPRSGAFYNKKRPSFIKKFKSTSTSKGKSSFRSKLSSWKKKFKGKKFGSKLRKMFSFRKKKKK